MQGDSKRVAIAAIKMAISQSREEERELKKQFSSLGIATAAVDYGGDSLTSVAKIIERAVVAAKRENVVENTHVGEGSVAGATHEALTQINAKAYGLNVGGKIGIARHEDHVSVAIFLGVGMLNLDEVAIGLAHRVV